MMSNAAEAKPSNTVQFNVSGRHFQVSRSLIEQHPDSMLGQFLTSDDPGTIFIDRDGDIFAQVLNYLRYGSIILPANIPREMFLRDLEFYEIVCDDQEAVQSASDTQKHNDKDYLELVAQLRAVIEVEITGPNHHPVYAHGYLKQKGHLSKLPNGTFWSEWLKEVNPCRLENIPTMELWIGGALRGGFANDFKTVAWAKMCSRPLLFICSRPGGIVFTVDFGWTEEELSRIVDIDRFCEARDDDLLEFITVDLPMEDPSKLCTFSSVSLPTIRNRLLGPLPDNQERVEERVEKEGVPRNIWVEE